MKKEIEEDYRRYKVLQYSWIGRINTVQLPSKSQGHSLQRSKILQHSLYGNTRDCEEPRQHSGKRAMLEVSHQTSNYITNE
jgi:hypothetical protein